MEKSIVILASGGGSNARAILEYFKDIDGVRVTSIISNKLDAGVHDVAKVYKVPSYTFNKEERRSGLMTDKIISLNPDLVVLAGYLLKFPKKLIDTFPNKIINIHPALLPKYGGKGMYGMNVHRSVVEAKDSETGISIHFVNENYDEGQIIKQVSCKVALADDADIVQKKVLALEHKYYPIVIENLLGL